jgi:hypothetical protein
MAIQAAAVTAITAAMSYGIGSTAAGMPGLDGLPSFLQPANLFKDAAHALVGAARSGISGGSSGAGAASGAVAAFAGSLPFFSSLPEVGQLVFKTVVGGLASVAGGGKFLNGAVTGAFQYLFNDAQHGKRSSIWDDLRDYLDYSWYSLSRAPEIFAAMGKDLVTDPLEFLRRAGPGLVGLGMAVPVVGAAGGVASEAAAAEFNFTNTVLSNVATRPYINSPMLIREIMATGKGVADPMGLAGAVRYDVPGYFNGSQGVWQLVINPTTNTVYHFLFTSKP